MKTKFKGEVINGKIKHFDLNGVNEHLKSLEGCEIEYTIGKWVKNRTLQQNSYYWGWVMGYILEYCGYERNEAQGVHEYLKFLFLMDHEEDKKIPRVRGTKDMTTAEFTHWIERVKRWAAIELGVNIPNIDEVDLDKYYYYDN